MRAGCCPQQHGPVWAGGAPLHQDAPRRCRRGGAARAPERAPFASRRPAPPVALGYGSGLGSGLRVGLGSGLRVGLGLGLGLGHKLAVRLQRRVVLRHLVSVRVRLRLRVGIGVRLRSPPPAPSRGASAAECADAPSAALTAAPPPG
eukprot:scaffold28385_cov39-Phaeocystis_antarctica.AAC.1